MVAYAKKGDVCIFIVQRSVLCLLPSLQLFLGVVVLTGACVLYGCLRAGWGVWH